MTSPTVGSDRSLTRDTRPSYPQKDSLLIYYPAGDGLSRGSVVVRSGEKFFSDYYMVRKDVDKTEVRATLHSALTSILRTVPLRGLRYALKTENRADYSGVRPILDEVIRDLNRQGMQYGTVHLPEMEYVALYRVNAVEWEGNAERHIYVSSLNNGVETTSVMLSVTHRSLYYKIIRTADDDAVAANISAIRDSIRNINDRNSVVVWSNVATVNGILKNETGLTLSSAAKTGAKEIGHFIKSHSINLAFNALHNEHLAELSFSICEREMMDALKNDLQRSVRRRRGER